LSGARPSRHTYRPRTDADEPTRPDRVRRPPRLRTQAAVLALVPALVWAFAHPAAALAAVAAASLAANAVALARLRRRRARRPAPLAE